ncbi:DUF167 family protein [Devosia sp.]|uniref:DUF167 family protein n=1 Tax=Devosia sp. TaxID=1871048 RepID=UPI002F0143A2
MPGPFRAEPGGVTLYLRVTPNAGRDAIEGVETRADGTSVLRLRVRAVPDKGKANAAVAALLSKALGVPRSAVSVVAGHTARLKTVSVAGDPAVLEAAVAVLTRKS